MRMDVLILDRGHDVCDGAYPEGSCLHFVTFAQSDQPNRERIVRADLVPINARVWFGFEDADETPFTILLDQNHGCVRTYLSGSINLSATGPTHQKDADITEVNLGIVISGTECAVSDRSAFRIAQVPVDRQREHY